MSNHLILGTRKGLLQLEYNGKGWQQVRESFRAVPVSYTAFDPRNQMLWAMLDHGHWSVKLHRSPDCGKTWQEVAAPAYPEGTTMGDGKPAATSYLWCITPGGADQPNRLYIGTEPGGLFQSDDGGDSFQFVQSLWDVPERAENWFGGGRDYPGLCSIVVDPRDSQHIVIGISVGGVYETLDGGKTWKAHNRGLYANYLPNPYAEFGHDPHYILASPSNPDVLWQQNHCGIFRSTDSGHHWTNISQEGGLAYFGFAIAADAKNAETAWVIPAIDAQYRIAVDAALCVCRTDDGGKTWQDFRAGLPQASAYDVIFRHALDVDGERLAFGTTTGNVYVSEDRGESWACIGNNFPPVYSVKFLKES